MVIRKHPGVKHWQIPRTLSPRGAAAIGSE